jgi:transposase
MLGNEPKRKAHVVKDWLTQKGIKTLNWPPFSPDLNPIEHVWDELEGRMKKHQPKHKDDLKRILLQEWLGIGIDVTSKLVDSVPNRWYECVRMRGYPTRY